MSGLDEAYIELEQDAQHDAFSGRLKWARGFLGMTQGELAKRVGKSRPTIAAYENDTVQPDLAIVQLLAEQLNVDARYLAFGEGHGYDPSTRSPNRAVSCSMLKSGAESVVGEISLPVSIGLQIGLPEAGSKAVQLSFDEPIFELQARDWVFVDGSDREILGDGSLYAIQSSGGVSVIRTAPNPVHGSEPRLITDGHGRTHEVGYSDIRCIGRVKGLLRGW